MKLYSLSVLYKGDPKVHLLKAAYDVSSFSFFQRSSVQEFMTFTSQLIVERSEPGSRASVKEQEYLCHVYVRNDGLAAVVIADNEYPPRVCFTLLDKVLDEFSRQVSKIDWPSGTPTTINYTALDGYLSKYQNPREADAMTKVQAELDETKVILVRGAAVLNTLKKGASFGKTLLWPFKKVYTWQKIQPALFPDPHSRVNLKQVGDTSIQRPVWLHCFLYPEFNIFLVSTSLCAGGGGFDEMD
uniref:YKT6 v-SNARE homolog n=1 Tax=Anolis carolinensis TaxID=28377 RepID=A0A803U0K5_ANOCA